MLPNAPIDVKLAGEGGDAGHRVGIWHYLKVCRQISRPRANYFNQMQKNVPTLLHIVAFDLSYFLKLVSWKSKRWQLLLTILMRKQYQNILITLSIVVISRLKY